MKPKLGKLRPPYAYVPGCSAFPHPHSVNGYRFAPKLRTLDVGEGEEGSLENFRHALQLLKENYFWESHVYFEAEWNACSRQGNRAALCSSLILLAAALLKIQSKRYETAARMLATCSSKLADLAEELENHPE